MHKSLKVVAPLVAVLLGTALAAPALAQFGPPPPPVPQTGPARIWNGITNPSDYVSTAPVLDASLGAGSFTGVLDTATNQLCYILLATGVDKPTAAHIHLGAEGQAGAPVVTLANPADGDSGACVAVRPDIAAALVANPGGYYVNVHNAAYPAGAVRGQLRSHTPEAGG